jgi:hypothetical protein
MLSFIAAVAFVSLLPKGAVQKDADPPECRNARQSLLKAQGTGLRTFL